MSTVSEIVINNAKKETVNSSKQTTSKVEKDRIMQ